VWDTRVQDYTPFASETKREWPKPPFAQGPTEPAVEVSWSDAKAFCAWLTERERQAGRIGPGDSYRLPSDHEWSCAAGIGDREDPAAAPEQKSAGLPSVYAWGSAWPPPPDAGNFNGIETEGKGIKYLEAPLKEYRDGFPTTSPVGSFAPNRWGLYDISGNVWQRCEDLLQPGDSVRVVRGAAFSDNTPEKLKLACRIGRAPDHRSEFMGFRCVLEVGPGSGSGILPLQAPGSGGGFQPPSKRQDAAPTSPADGWQDLLAPLTPELVAQTGHGWRLEKGELIGPAKAYSVAPLPGSFASLSYQVRLKIRKLDATFGDFHVVLPVGDRMTGFMLDGFDGQYTGLNKVNGQTGKDLPGIVEGRQVKGNGSHDLEITVQLEGPNARISTTLDAHSLYAWSGPISALSQNQAWATTAPGFLALGTYSASWAVSEVKARRLGPGQQAPTSEQWQDLIAPLTPELVTPSGWRLAKGELTPPQDQAAVQLPANFAGASYQVHLQIRKRVAVGGTGLIVLLPVGESMAGFNLDGNGGTNTTLGMVNGKGDLAPVLEGAQITDTDRHDLDITVQLEGKNARITASLDAHPLYTWNGPSSALSLYYKWATTAPGFLALDSAATFWTVSEVKARRLDDGAGRTGVAPPATGPSATASLAQTPTRTGAVIAATKDAPFVNSLGMKFVPVPGTKVLFCIHETRKDDYAAFAAANPGVAGFWKNPMRDGVPVSFAGNHPVCEVRWEDAKAFCAWLSQKEGITYRLPTDREWSYAVGIGDKEDPSLTPKELSGLLRDQYPWGRQWPPPPRAGNFGDTTFHEKFPERKFVSGYTDGFATTAPVMSFTPNALGIYDLAGNVWEYCEDWFDSTQTSRTVRGANWDDSAFLLSSARSSAKAETRHTSYGFRCVLEIPAPDSSLVNSLGMKFVPVPIIGGPTAGKPVLFSVWDTRVQDYAVFVQETKRPSPEPGFEQGPTHPVVKVSWNDATAFCTWLTERERKAGRIAASDRYRLPSDHEWSCAVGLGEREDPALSPIEKDRKIAGIYPWGTAWPPPPNAGNYAGEEVTPHLHEPAFTHITSILAGYRDNYPATAPVGSFPANRFGLFDMGGNVWQWCEDFLAPGRTRVMRGAAWDNRDPFYTLSSGRFAQPAATSFAYAGFRCVLELAPRVAVTPGPPAAPAATPSAPGATPLPTTPPSPARTDGWEDLLAQLTPVLVGQTGNGWQLKAGELFSPAGHHHALPLPGTFGQTSYQVRLKVRPPPPSNDALAIVLPVANRKALFILDGYPQKGFCSGLEMIDGKTADLVPGSLHGRQIKGSELHDLEVSVVLNGADTRITVTLDSHSFFDWSGPIASLSVKPSWPAFAPTLLAPGLLALGSMDTGWTVTEVKAKRVASPEGTPRN
jgi:formylglycine-generating enzyme required for sulfatase activity